MWVLAVEIYPWGVVESLQISESIAEELKLRHKTAKPR